MQRVYQSRKKVNVALFDSVLSHEVSESSTTLKSSRIREICSNPDALFSFAIFFMSQSAKMNRLLGPGTGFSGGVWKGWLEGNLSCPWLDGEGNCLSLRGKQGFQFDEVLARNEGGPTFSDIPLFVKG